MSRLDPRRRALLDAMGIEVWASRDAVADEATAPASVPSAAVMDSSAPLTMPAARPVAGSIEALDWEALAACVAVCRECGLHETRTQTVFGVGARRADWQVIGEAPGAEEDKRGEPFVGRAGQLLNAMLAAVGLAREQVYIANILKCRPPQNRDPKPEEALACSRYLARQVALVEPRIILAVGRIAAQNLLHTETPIGRLRGKVHAYGERAIPLVVTYHPAYLLRSPGEKGKAWSDLLLARATVEAGLRA